MIDTISTQAQLPGDNALVLLAEAHYVAETATGLLFRSDTPIELWGALVERLQRQQKVIEWALADAINFGEQAYSEDYAQWIDETGLSKRTLQNIARIGRAIEPARRRADVSFAHHAEVATLPISDQESLLDAAVHAGMTRYDLRDAVRERKRQIEGCAVTRDGVPVEPADDLDWHPTKADLVDEARAALEIRLSEMRPSKRSTFESAALWAWGYADDLELFKQESE